MDTCSTIAEMAGDELFLERLRACAGQQGVPDDPWTWVHERRYVLCSSPTWAEKVDYWRNVNGEKDGWQNLQEVIPDADILAAVQSIGGA